MKILFLLMIPFLINAQSLRTKVNEGNTHYQAAEYEQAINKYKDALLDDPLHEVALFNEADALFKMEKYEEARAGYQKLLATKDLGLASQAHFNIGNTFFKEDKLPESIESYKRALELSPNDFDAKYNLELARAKLKEQSEKQQQDPNQDQQSQQQENQDQQQSDQNEENQEQQEQQQQAEQEQEQQEMEEQQAQEAQEREKEINKDEAERILNALKADEQKAQENKPPVKGTGRVRGKDW